MRNGGLFCFLIAVTIFMANRSVEGRPQYKTTIDTMEAETDAEKALQTEVKANKCNYCHDKADKKKKTRTEYGQKLHDALGGGSKENFKFDKADWKKGNDAGNKKAIEDLRRAINEVGINEAG